jgi:hypothetical protein
MRRLPFREFLRAARQLQRIVGQKPVGTHAFYACRSAASK